MTKNQTVELLQKQLPGFYSVEQVIEMINNIEYQAYNENQLKILIKKIKDEVENQISRINSSDVVRFDSAEFELNGNEISILDIDLDVSNIIDEVESGVRDVITDFFGL